MHVSPSPNAPLDPDSIVYHLNRKGITLGRHSLVVLRKQRIDRELEGTELVWTRGMVEWRPLDEILHQARATPRTAPPQLPRKTKTTSVVLWLVCGFLALTAVTLGSLALVSRLKKVTRAWSGRPFVTSGPTSTSSFDGSELIGPIKWTPKSRTALDFRDYRNEYLTRHLLEPYRQHADHGAPGYTWAIRWGQGQSDGVRPRIVANIVESKGQTGGAKGLRIRRVRAKIVD